MRLILKNIKLYYLSDLALRIDNLEKDCPIGITGFSGSGKTNLIKVIAGLEIIKEGEIFLDDKEITYLKPKNRNISLISKHTPLFSNKSVQYNLQFPLKKRKMKKQEIEEKINFFKEKYNLDLQKEVNELNENEKTDLLIYRALIKNPDLILIDEPYEICNLTQYFVEKIKSILPKEKIVLASFDYDLVKELIDKPIKLKSGEIYG